ncbi:hypothetical protein RTBOTA2_006936, partial [Rhodotorula toruloides]
EVRRGIRYDDKADMHSLGCLLYDVCTLSVPEAKDFNSVPDRLPNGKLSDYSPDLQRLIQDLLEDQPYLRELLATGYIWTWYRNIRLWAVDTSLRKVQSKVAQDRQEVEEHKQKIKVQETELQAHRLSLDNRATVLASKQKELDERERHIARQERILHRKRATLDSRYAHVVLKSLH